MALLVNKQDFVGEFQFQFQNDPQYWDDFLDAEENLVLTGLFGETLFLKLKANPLDTDFDPIRGVFYHNWKKCRGLVYVAKAFLYCRLVEHDGIISSHSVSKISGDTATPVSINANFTRAWNNAVDNAIVLRAKLTEPVTGLEAYKFIDYYQYSNRIY